MGIGAVQSNLLREMKDRGFLASIETLCELGSQVPRKTELAELVPTHTVDGDLSAPKFYSLLGIENYTSIDFNGELGALRFDLNNDLRVHYSYAETFDLVTNFGTSEHCFNQHAVFKNIHDLCRPDGFMVHTLPTQGWGRHCFFRYDPNVFNDLAGANNYELVFLQPYLNLRSTLKKGRGRTIDHILTLCTYILGRMERSPEPAAAEQDVQAAVRNVGKHRALFNVTLACILRKRNDGPFVTPIQGMYRAHKMAD